MKQRGIETVKQCSKTSSESNAAKSTPKTQRARHHAHAIELPSARNGPQATRGDATRRDRRGNAMFNEVEVEMRGDAVGGRSEAGDKTA